jgi:hypothetical protein
MRRGLSVLLVGLLLVGLVACGSSSKSSSQAQGTGTSATQTSGVGKTRFAKTKFVLHTGLAFGAFHRYIYKPFRSGGFSPPLRHKAALVKAGLAAVFAYHEIKIALMDARSSRLLSKLVSPLTALQAKLSSLGASLKRGKLDAGQINSANADVNSASALSAKAGQPIADQPTPSLGG